MRKYFNSIVTCGQRSQEATQVVVAVSTQACSQLRVEAVLLKAT